MPIGKRPTPKVARGKSPSFKKDTGRNYSGVRGTKKPTGSRPTPSVAKGRATVPSPPGPVAKPIKKFDMPRSRAKAKKPGSY